MGETGREFSEKRQKEYSRHRIVIDERERMSVTGVTEVVSFDEESIMADTDMGMLIIRGNALHISKLNLDEGILQTEGEIESIEYTDGDISDRGGMFFRKIFRTRIQAVSVPFQAANDRCCASD